MVSSVIEPRSLVCVLFVCVVVPAMQDLVK
jgi:hypothetical protein